MESWILMGSWISMGSWTHEWRTAALRNLGIVDGDGVPGSWHNGREFNRPVTHVLNTGGASLQGSNV